VTGAVFPGDSAPSPGAPGAARRVRDGAAGLRRLVDGLDWERLGEELHALVRELYPLDRSVTGDGLRRSLRRLGELAPMRFDEVPSGTRVLDWTVPREWTVRSARLVAPDGEVLADYSRSNLEVVAYSVPVRRRVSLAELQPHLHSLPDRPSVVPYRTSFFREDWGFCLPHATRERLRDGTYEVSIDASLEAGAMTLGEIVVPGYSEDEVLVSTHTCHPSLANDNLSGMVVAAALGRAVASVERRLTYRFVFVPTTIGAIAWLARNEGGVARVRHGLVLAGVGDDRPLRYKRSRRGDADVDRAMALVLRDCGAPHELLPFAPVGYDERQYCSPGYDLPVGALSRGPSGGYPEYHTSADRPEFVRPERLTDTVRRCLELFEVLEGNRSYLNLSPRGEPMLGRRGVFDARAWPSHSDAALQAAFWALNLSDGQHALVDVAERSGLPFFLVRGAAEALEEAGLLEGRAGGDSASGKKGRTR
jgi:aminopeptidase-like protein